MIRRPWTYIIVLMAVFQLGLAQNSIEQKNISQSVVDLGQIGKDKVDISYETSFKHPGDMSWYKFNVTEPQKLFFTAAERGTYYGFIVLDKNMSYIYSGELVLQLPLQSGTYFARVEAYPIGKSSYQELNASLNYTLLAGNAFEKESNDGLSDANDLGAFSGTAKVAGKISPLEDIDFFKFIVPEGSPMVLRASALTSSELNDYIKLALYRYNESMEQFIPESLVSGNSIVIVPGSYFVRV
jgi:hypothetical protein